MDRQVRIQLAGGLALAATGALGVLVVSPERALASLAGTADRPVLFALALVGLYGVRSLVLWPISALSLLVGFVYGPAVGIPIGLAGAVYTCLPPYLLARYAPRQRGPLARLHALGRSAVEVTGDLRGLIAARLVPMPADAVSYAAGLAEVPVGRYALGTALGETPWVVATVLAGASMRTFALEAAGSTLSLLLAATLLGVVLLSGPAYRHLRRRGVLDGPAIDQ
ncbi:TVP38/TMEM64 family protein [Halapricum desulfuricans]|uniref:Putative membrane protein YdjX, TVP38/TMEM64 family, SNARE-associated domain n=1 Tax=Halapricum desulfuricans TaxID=2841257 RepID=A0A897N9G7_9EURY|nr:VTT domain-containing protein [Halapricum desulfuricans]QSG09061.1 putative membrane protein YdjX, TVP38/TMEM64 family, SNARE-associated domain [Halapricum desulfuricans]